jgi:tetrapyrrole methylase family protein/MazG family protein
VSSFEELIRIVRVLRGPNGCPWDKDQTLKTLTPYILEEAYELVDAIENGKLEDVKEELGDALLHVVMLSNIAEEESTPFNVYDVAEHVGKKMIHRHPHVFGDTKVNSVDDVWKNWEALKKQEKAPTQSAMDTIPKHLPALLQSHKIQKRAERLGFDWPDQTGAFEKLQEEVKEYIEVAPGNTSHKEEEAGDLLFALVNILRKDHINPEEALRKANQKFITRFKHMEKTAKETHQDFEALSLEEKEKLWQLAKKAS